MDTTTLLIIIVVLLLLGGGWYGRGRWYSQSSDYQRAVESLAKLKPSVQSRKGWVSWLSALCRLEAMPLSSIHPNAVERTSF